MSKWQPGEALRYAGEDYHDREYWRDNNTTHATIWTDCKDETCLAIRDDLARQDRLEDALVEIGVVDPTDDPGGARRVWLTKIEPLLTVRMRMLLRRVR